MIVILCIPTEKDYFQIPLNPFCYKTFAQCVFLVPKLSQFLQFLTRVIFRPCMHAGTEMKPDFTQNMLSLCSQNENHKYQPTIQPVLLMDLHQLFRKFYEKTQKDNLIFLKMQQIISFVVWILISGFQSLSLNKFLICISL